MGVDWYDMIARRNGGYGSSAVYSTVGKSAEEIFEERLINMMPNFKSILDAGCGHGEFTLNMSKYANRIIGFDNSKELLAIAQTTLRISEIDNVEFVLATTKEELPFDDEQFDLIYDRRGPTSIINHGRILAAGGTIFGIHINVDKVREQLIANGYKEIEIEEYNEAISYFPNEVEFAKFLSAIPGNPDYTSADLKSELEVKISEHNIDGRLGIKEHKYIWKATRP
ncbi:class I SAM-dependent methyltransferase [Cohnella yongneupensis]|uniref:Class I SAM-dependent methyltransferase n=1 Tax=Cohnella yongneupensis TaxID=425006 RepID=A0ABW0QTN6_9BACL